MSAQNLTLLTDLYELTMMQGYFETQENQTVISTYFSVRTQIKVGTPLWPALIRSSIISRI